MASLAPNSRSFVSDGPPIPEAEPARQLSAEALQWRQLYEAVLANTPDLGYVFDLDHRFTYANDALLAMWGRTWDQAIGKTCLELGYEPWHAAMHDREIEQVIATRKPVRGDVPFTGTNGRRVYDYIFFPVLGASGEVVAVAGSTRDVTDSRNTEEALREGEKRYRELLDALPVAVYTTDAEGRITLYNEAAAVFAGRRAEPGKDQWCVTHRLYRPDGAFLPHDECPMAVTLRTGEPQHGVEAIAERPDGTRAWFMPHPTALRDASGKITGGINVLVDITERKRAETLLVEQKQLLERIATGCPLEECLIVLTATVTRLWPKVRAAVLIADEARASIESAVAANIAPSLGDGIRGAPIDDVAFGACGTAIFEGKVVTCTDIASDERWSKPWRDLCLAHDIRSCHSTPVFTGDEQAIASFLLCFDQPHEPDDWERTLGQFGAHIAGIAIDRERAAHALREGEKRLAADLADMQQLQSISAEVIYEENADALYEKILHAALAIMRSDFGGMQMLYPERGKGGELRLLAYRGFNAQAAAFWEWVRADSESTCGAALRTGKRVIVPNIEQCEWMAGTGDLANYLQTGIHAVQTTPLLSRGGNLLGMISTHWREPHEPAERELRLLDVLARQAADLIERKLNTDRQKQSEAALRKSEKFAGAGRMAATIAHEINNPLEAIVNLWYLLSQDQTLSADGQELLKTLGSELSRVSHITKQTLQFYRDGKTPGPVDLAEPLNAAVSLFSRKAVSAGTNIETHYRTSATIFGFAGELRQVFANLIGNALEAGATGIKIRVSPGHDWKHRARRGVRVTVADNGSGIPADSARKLFEPFFTTKDEKGTGLGLWVSKGIVQKHEGWIRMRTSTQPARHGTTFELFLPTL